MGAHPIRAWFGLIAGLAAWFAHLGISYAIAAHACGPGRAWLFHATTAGTLALAAAGLWAAWRSLPPADRAEEPGSQRRHHRRGFMALSGVVLSLSFLFVIVVQAVPNLVFDPCR